MMRLASVGALLSCLLVVEGNRLSFRGPYSGKVAGWNFQGSTVVTDDYVRLTPAEAGHEGAIWSNEPMPYRNWELELQYRVSGARYLGGDGFALWFTEQSENFGGTFGNQDDFAGVGIIFDTYDNDGKRDNPSISAISSDGSERFDHNSDGRKQRLQNAMCKINYRNPRNPVAVRVKYDQGVLSVGYDLRSKGQYTDCFKLEDIQMPSKYFVGITAHTGQVADNHDIHQLLTTSLDPEDEEAGEVKVDEEEKPQEGHLPHETAAEQHEWRKDDDRHLQRFAEAVQRFAELTPELQAHARNVRIEAMQARLSEYNDEDDGYSPTEEPNDDVEDMPRRRSSGDADPELGQKFKDEVSETLAIIQEEIKQIAHEMRGTITLAHAVTQNADSGSKEGGGASASDLIVGFSEILQKSEKSIEHSVNSAGSAQRAELDAIKASLKDIGNTLRNNVMRNSQETSSKLSQIANDVTKMKSQMEDMKRKQDYSDKKGSRRSASSDEESGQGYSVMFLILTQLPWVGFFAYQMFGPRGKGGRDFPLGGSSGSKYL